MEITEGSVLSWFGCTRLYLLYLEMAVLWTKSRYFGNLVSTIAMSESDYKLVPFEVHAFQI